MGWGNPAVSWSEMERILAGRPARPSSGTSRTGQDGGGAPEVDGPGTVHPADVSAVGVREAGRRSSRDVPHPGDGGDSPAWSRTRAPYRPPVDTVATVAPPTVPFAELHTHSTYSFLDGASQPEELVEEAHRLGLEAVALTDHDGMYGVVRFAEAARELGVRTVFGAELSLGLSAPQNGVADPEGEHLLVLARDPAGYRAISHAITEAAMDPAAEKGRPIHDLERTAATLRDHVVVLTGCRKGHVRRALDAGGPDAAARAMDRLVGLFGTESVAVELTDHGLPADVERNDVLAGLAARAGLATVASTAAHYATPDRARVAAALGAVRARRSLDEAEGWLPPGTVHLRSGAEMAARFARHPEAVTHAAVLGRECAFELSLLAPELPPFDVPAGETETSWLRHLTDRGARDRYGSRADNPRAWEVIDHEMAIIEGQGFPGYFLIVADIVDFCRKEDIYCQGRGSAANSAVCFALGITHVDAVEMDLLFERFLSPERDGYPDIDLDIESDRREEAIQYVYDRYGRDRAAQVANVITYRPRSAVRDAARALGFAQGQQDAWSKLIDRWGRVGDGGAELGDQVPGMPRSVASLAEEIASFPRHLGIHSGGMVICDRPVDQVVPVEWARMKDRSVIQWDKDDAAAVGLVKFDLLGLGMLSVLHYASDYVAAHHGRRIELHELQPTDPEVFAMLARGDSVGVFQVESRAQMATLPRLKPRVFYDLVVEVALIRPGPIQGGSVHPFIRRRNGEERVTYDHPLCEPALYKTLGVPLFQEQLMQLATDVAGFSAAEADELRRALSSKRSEERLERLRERFYAGMAANQITGELADRIFAKTKAFANFGFPESHSISFASLVYVSAWFKHYFPAAFCAALLRAQPMGFYSPQSLVADARRHSVVVLGPDVLRSRAEPGLEPHPDSEGGVAVRLGLAGVRGLGDEVAERVVQARDRAPFTGPADLARRADLTTAHLEALATGGALGCFGLERREALWAAGAAAAGTAAVRAGVRHDRLPDTAVGLDAPALPGMSAVELTIADVWATGLTPDGHPVTHLRAALEERGAFSVAGVAGVGEGERIEVGGVVTHRQRPATAGGTTFLNLEDETGMLNVVCSEGLWARHRVVARTSAALVIRGRVERAHDAPSVVNLVADRVERLDLRVPSRSRDFQ
jgi:error-prone DNA polymerase